MVSRWKCLCGAKYLDVLRSDTYVQIEAEVAEKDTVHLNEADLAVWLDDCRCSYVNILLSLFRLGCSVTLAEEPASNAVYSYVDRCSRFVIK